MINSSKKQKKWTKYSVAKIIIEKSQNGYCKTTDTGMTVSGMARRIFGTFEKACEYAGVKAWSQKKLKTCKIDGCDKKPRSRASDYCETHYYRLRRTGLVHNNNDVCWLMCNHCGKQSSGNKYCSKRCASRITRNMPVNRYCVVCGIEYNPTNNGRDTYTCSDKCKLKRKRYIGREWRRSNITIRREKERLYEYKRKAQKKNTQYEEIVREDIFKRDSYICLLCNKPLNMDAQWPNPYFATLDHIVPLAKGGTHTKNNIQSAHLRCNIFKSDKDMQEFVNENKRLPGVGLSC